MAGGSKPTTMPQNLEEIRKVFNRLDVNGDKKISAAELIDALKVVGTNPSDEEVKEIMEEFDTDQDGFINLEEFTKLCSGYDDVEGGLEELREAFDLYDQDKNGLISAAELHQIMSKIIGEHCTLQDCSAMIKSVDSDGDGFVSFEEFKKMMTNSSR